jgi:hypothetical protein
MRKPLIFVIAAALVIVVGLLLGANTVMARGIFLCGIAVGVPLLVIGVSLL